MGFDLTNVKSIAIPDGNVKSISVGGVEIWKKESAPPADKYSWEAVLASVRAGTYATDYAVGDLIPTDLGTEGLVSMQIAGFDVDDRADGNGKAHISFISKELLNTNHRMNPARTPSSAPYNEGTGSIGGWEKSEMRTHLKETIKPLIPSVVRSAILEVTKTNTAYDTAGSFFTQTTQDDVWLPAWNEINGSSARYATLFPDNSSKIKYRVGEASSYYWWTRQASNSLNFYRVTMDGSENNSNPTYANGVALGFCI